MFEWRTEDNKYSTWANNWHTYIIVRKGRKQWEMRGKYETYHTIGNKKQAFEFFELKIEAEGEQDKLRHNANSNSKHNKEK